MWRNAGDEPEDDELELEDLDLDDKAVALAIEVGQALSAAREKPREAVVDFFLRELSGEALNSLLDSMAPANYLEFEHPGHMPLVTAALNLHSHLQRDKTDGASASGREMADMVSTLYPYLIIEYVRRRQCFEVLEIPANPWAYHAAIRVAEPHRPNIERTVEELKSLDWPCPPLLRDEELLREMETDDIGVELIMPVPGRTVIDEEKLNIRPHKMPPLDPQKFAAVFYEANDIGGGLRTMQFMDVSEAVLAQKHRKIKRFDGNDTPPFRVVRVFQQRFSDDPEQARSAAARFFAVMQVIGNEALEPWMPDYEDADEDEMRIHPFIVAAAATVRLTTGGLFPPAKFVQEVERLAKEAGAGPVAAWKHGL